MWASPRHAVPGETIAGGDDLQVREPQTGESHALEGPAPDWRACRRRLFVVLGWTGAGLGVTAAFALLFGLFHFVFLSRIEAIEIGMGSMGLSTAAGFACVFAVVWLADEFCAGSRRRARVLLCVTCAVYALLMNVFTAGVITEGLMETASHDAAGDGVSGHVTFLALTFIPVLAVVGLCALTVLGVAVSIGYDGSNARTAGRWAAFAVLIAGPLIAIDPALWWIGLLGSLLLAWGADQFVAFALRRPDLPEEALSACLVALVAAVAIWIVYLIVRVLGRVALFGLKHAPRIFSLAR